MCAVFTISFLISLISLAPSVFAAGLTRLGFAAFTESRRQLNTFSYFDLTSFDYSVELPQNAAMVSLHVESSSSLTLKDDDGQYYPLSSGYFHGVPVDENTTLYLTVKDIGTYSINFTKPAPASDDASISSAYYEFYKSDGSRLVGKQFNDFSESVTEYSFDMPEGASYFTFQPSVSSGASVSYTAGGESVSYGHIPVDSKSVTVTVTAAAGNSKTYTINFNDIKEESSSSEAESSSSESSSSSAPSSSSSLASSSSSSSSSQSSSVSESSKAQTTEPHHITNSLVSSFIIFSASLIAIVVVLVMVLRTGLHKKN